MSKHLSNRPNRKFIHHPFWQADKPYLHDNTITDARFRRLGYMMAFSAGAINAAGFFVVASYTSHITGALSRVADSIFMGEWQNAFWALVGVWCFIFGAACANFTILWGKRHHFRSCYGLAMWAEAFWLMIFALFGMNIASIGILPTLILLCFIMGMHNTVTSVLSGSAIRSTHMTGSATDLGVELSRVFYYIRVKSAIIPELKPNFPKMWLLLGMINNFVIGGVVGTYLYSKVGFYFTVPIAMMLFIFGIGSVGYDVKVRLKWWLIQKIRQRKRIRRQAEREQGKRE